MRGLPRIARGFVLAGLVATVGWACGGGGGGGGGGTPPPTEPVPGVTFTGGSAGANSISLVHANAGSTTSLRLRVQANDVQDLYGIGFDLVFPEALLSYDGAVEGSFLSGSGAQTSLQVFQSAPGRIVVGVSRLGPVGGASGTGGIVEIELAVQAAGSGSVGFENRQGFDSDGDPISGLEWAGGTVRIVR